MGAAGSRAEGASTPARDTGLLQSGFCPALTHPPRAQEVLTRPLGAARSWREGVPALIVAPDQLLHFLSLFLLHSSNTKPVSPGFAGDCRLLPLPETAGGHAAGGVPCPMPSLLPHTERPSRWPVFMIRHVHAPASCPRGTWFPDSLTVVRV